MPRRLEARVRLTSEASALTRQYEHGMRENVASTPCEQDAIGKGQIHIQNLAPLVLQ